MIDEYASTGELGPQLRELLERPARSRRELEEWYEAVKSAKDALAERARSTRISTSAWNNLWRQLVDVDAGYKDPDYAASQQVFVHVLIEGGTKPRRDRRAVDKAFLKTLARQILHRLPRFAHFDAANLPPEWSFQFMEQDDVALGLYENTPGSREGAVLVTCKGSVVIGEAGNARIAFADVREAKWRAQTKEQEAGVEGELRNGDTFFVPIKGRRHEGPDAYFFAEFVERMSLNLYA
jgi:hypothetical protein